MMGFYITKGCPAIPVPGWKGSGSHTRARKGIGIRTKILTNPTLKGFRNKNNMSTQQLTMAIKANSNSFHN